LLVGPRDDLVSRESLTNGLHDVRINHKKDVGNSGPSVWRVLVRTFPG
jgi:hypothetical protein